MARRRKRRPTARSVRLDRQIDVSRGDLFSSVDSTARVSQEISADVCWFDTEPALMSQPYVLKQSVNTVRAKFQAIDHRIDVQSLQPEAAPPTLEMNDIARVRLKVTKPIAFDLYEDNRTTGAFVLIDERTNRTVAAGTIR